MQKKINVEFPCGYKYNIEEMSGMLDFGNYRNESMPTECPIHGKKCFREHA